jgi:hypothetical protein
MTAHRVVTFIQDDEPPLKAGEYTITAHQKAPSQPEPNDFSATRIFAVAGERFQIDPAEIAGVFPPNLGNGEYSGALPHVLFNRRTLPWERTSVAADTAAAWLAVLLFDDGDAPTPLKKTAKDLVPAGTTITVYGSSVTGVGALEAGIASYPGLTKLDYGETPDDECMTIDVDAQLFSSIAPSVADLHYLSHLREADTIDSHDTVEASKSLAVVLGNRVPLDNQRAHAFLVSLENMGPLLPAEDGTRSANLTAATVRLVAFRWWTFTANTMGETFVGLLEAVNSPPPPGQTKRLTSLQVPFSGPRPGESQVQQAMNDQATGKLLDGDADVLVRNAFAMGYVPLGHQLRHGGQTVSWYRGPLAPYAVTTAVQLPIPCPDAANRYDPQTGMFDVSYGAAWQVGRLLALQNEAFAMALYNWRRHVRQAAAMAAEQEVMEQLLGGSLETVTAARRERLTADAQPTPPHQVVRWLAHLSLLYGVPFNYLVPHEQMLPPESLRVFHVDRAWVEALLDGAFSIGRATTGEHAFDADHLPGVRTLVAQEAREVRPNMRPETTHVNTTGEVTGFLLRSQAVAGWPHVNVFGYDDPNRKSEIPKLRLARLSSEVMLGLFDGVVDVLLIHEAPGQLHCGVEGAAGAFTTTLREVNLPTPGYQYDGSSAPVVARKDKQTLMIATAAAQIQSTLETQFKQVFTQFTSAEFALEMMKGVSEVEFRQGG